MTYGDDMDRDDKGLTARQLLLMFLAGVAVCAVFFAAGYLVGYNEGTAKSTLATVQVNEPQAIPPTVNPPLNPSGEKERSAAANPEATAPAPFSQAPRAEPAAQTTAPAEAPSSPVASGPIAAPSSALPTTAGGQAGAGFTIQVVASTTAQDAQKIVNVLKSSGYSAFLLSPQEAHANDNLYRVQVGPFSTRDEAEKVKAKLIQDGFKQPFIKH